MPKSLYICYFGVREPLVQTQVIPYLLEIARDGVDVSLLTFEPDLKNSWTDEQIDRERTKLRDRGITWHHLAYHKTPSVPATLFDIFNGTRLVRKLLRTENFDILHGRVHVATLIAALARRTSGKRPKLLFDIRGFFPEEYTDAGIWPENGLIYRSVKRVETWLMKEADGYVVLTEKAREILFPNAAGSAADGYLAATAGEAFKSQSSDLKPDRSVEVIPCCVDLDRFSEVDSVRRRDMRANLGVGERFVLIYVGSFGGWYLSDEMFDLFAAARRVDPQVFVSILTQRQADSAASALRAKGFEAEDFHVATVSPGEIPAFLSAADAAVSFIKPCFSKLASSPTKNAEYLAAGLPIVANSGVGDVDAQLDLDGTGILVDDFLPATLELAFSRIRTMTDRGEECRRSARERFDLEKIGGTRYRRIYRKLLDPKLQGGQR